MPMPEESTRFRLTPEHLKLVRRMYVGWQYTETGAPEVDPKRPYGNRDVADDVAEILGVDLGARETAEEEEREDALRRLHRETEVAVQIVLAHAGEAVEPGWYERANTWTREWRRVDDDVADVAMGTNVADSVERELDDDAELLLLATRYEWRHGGVVVLTAVRMGPLSWGIHRGNKLAEMLRRDVADGDVVRVGTAAARAIVLGNREVEAARERQQRAIEEALT